MTDNQEKDAINGRIIIAEYDDKDQLMFDDILDAVKRHSNFQKVKLKGRF